MIINVLLHTGQTVPEFIINKEARRCWRKVLRRSTQNYGLSSTKSAKLMSSGLFAK